MFYSHSLLKIILLNKLNYLDQKSGEHFSRHTAPLDNSSTVDRTSDHRIQSENSTPELMAHIAHPNKVKTAVQCFSISRTVLAGFSFHCDSIYNIYFLDLKNKKNKKKLLFRNDKIIKLRLQNSHKYKNVYEYYYYRF